MQPQEDDTWHQKPSLRLLKSYK
jgi:hypothetical protein